MSRPITTLFMLMSVDGKINMTEEEFQRILKEMELPKEQCRHTRA